MSEKLEEVLQMPVISTGHITKETAESIGLAEGDVFPVGDLRHWVDEVRYGYLLTVSLEEDTYEDGKEPEDLLTISRWAQAQGFRKVLLDTDGQQVEELPYYDW